MIGSSVDIVLLRQKPEKTEYTNCFTTKYATFVFKDNKYYRGLSLLLLIEVVSLTGGDTQITNPGYSFFIHGQVQFSVDIFG